MILMIAACLCLDLHTACSESLTTLTFYSQKKTWNEAHKICSDDGGYIIKENTSQITDLLNIFDDISPWSTQNLNNGFWIGLVADLSSCSNQFHWSDCQPMTYVDWHPSDPSSPCNNPCIYRMKPNQNWKTSECNSDKYFICEKHGGTCPEEIYNDITGKPSPSSTSNTNDVNVCRESCETASCQAFGYNTGSGLCSKFLNNDPFYFTKSINRKSSIGTTFYVRHCYKLETDSNTYSFTDTFISHRISCGASETTASVATTSTSATERTEETTAAVPIQTTTPEETTVPTTTTDVPTQTTTPEETTTDVPTQTATTEETTTDVPTQTATTEETTSTPASTVTQTSISLTEKYTTTSFYTTDFSQCAPSNLSSQCVCYLSQAPTEEQDLLAVIEEIKQELKIQKSLLTLPKLKKISASDDRVSAQVMGWVAVVVIIGVSSLIVVPDILKVVLFISSMFNSLFLQKNIVETTEMKDFNEKNSIDSNVSQDQQNISYNESLNPDLNTETEFSNAETKTSDTALGEVHITSHGQDSTSGPSAITHLAEVHNIPGSPQIGNISSLRNKPELMKHESFDV